MDQRQSDLSTRPENLLFITDLDDTLITRKEPRKMLEEKTPLFLEKMLDAGVFLAISSRNTPADVYDILERFQLDSYFQDIQADYRPKEYHVKNILMNLKKKEAFPSVIVFIDDFLENCIRVKSLKIIIDIPLYVIVYKSKVPQNLETISNLIIKSDFTNLEDLSL